MRAKVLLLTVLVLFAAGVLLLLGGGGTLNGQQGEAAAEREARIEKLIRQLDDDKFEVREKAEKELAEIGEPAVGKLAAAAKEGSAEQRQRAAKVLTQIRSSGLGLRSLSTFVDLRLAGAVTIALSPDGNFVYVPAWKMSAVNIFRRDAVTGALEYRGNIADGQRLGGVLTVRLSPDGKQAVAAAFSTKSIALLLRDVKTGDVVVVSARQSSPAEDLVLEKPVDAIFSTDGKFVYAVDDRQATVVVFEVREGKRLHFVQALEGPDRCFDGARAIAAHPDGKTLYMTSFRAGTLSVLDRDVTSGKVSVRQVLSDEQGDIHGLAGAMVAVVSRDGRFVYTTSGRFAGDNAVGVYGVGGDGKLSLVQEFINEQGELKDFKGGNQLALSPDETQLYASGTTSCSLACFRRDVATGRLDYITTICNEATGLGANLGANGIVCSPDGRFVYLALEDAGAISVFERMVAERR